MNVGRIMSKNTVCTNPDVSVNDARAIMRREGIGRMPVLDKNNNLVGIVTELDIINASPSAATTLDIYEMNALLAKLKVEKVMQEDVIVVTEDMTIEEAARIMADNNISGLPVLRNDQVVGIITESDVFKFFIDLFGARTLGLRATMYLKEKPGVLSNLSQKIASLGGNIITVVTCPGNSSDNKLCTIKVSGIEEAAFKEAVESVDGELVDIRTC